MSYNFAQFKIVLGTRDNWGSIQNNMISALSSLDDELEVIRNGKASLQLGMDARYLSVQAGRQLLDAPFPSTRLLYLLARSGNY